MNESAQSILDSMAAERADFRIHFFEVALGNAADGLTLSGRVLDEGDLRELRARLGSTLPGMSIDTHEVQVLRKPGIPVLAVGTNLTSLHRTPSFLAEYLSQLTNGMQVEVLFQEERWCFVRQMDGYLGWTYKPYLSDAELLRPSHLVVSPVIQLRAGPGKEYGVLTRVLGGTALTVLNEQSPWMEVALCGGIRGWLPQKTLRSYSELPQTSAQRRAQMQLDVARMTGTPYLWGGCSANGIDCSGLAQLLHRWVGISIPRDGDQQFEAAKAIEPPFQPGDLLFFGEKGEKRRITHVAVSLGGWDILHSSRSRNGVYVDDVQTVEHLRESFLFGASYLGE